jgi:RNA polymerase sigma-70 factor (ECF subfamily)
MTGRYTTPDRPSRGGRAPAEPAASASDDSLVRWLRAGNETAASRLYGRYVARLRALARAKLSAELSRRVDPEDIVQSVFRRFFQAARQGNYDAPRGEDLWDLLLVITLNRIRSEKSFQRAAKRDVRRTAPAGPDGCSLEAIAERDDLAGALLRMYVAEALEQLPADYRRVVELRMEGHEVAEIAGLTGRSKRTVERILQESRGVLRGALCENP